MKYTLFIVMGLSLISCAGRSKTDSSAAAATDSVESAVEFNADSAYSYVDTQVDMGPRVPGSAAHARCAEYISSELTRHGADTVILQKGETTDYKGNKMPITNIMGKFNPQASKRILIAAHYDTRPWADAETDESKHNTPIPGANDGGSGVGVMLEIARQLGLKNPEVGVDLLFVDAEDSGSNDGWGDHEETWCLGTQYWGANLPYANASERPIYGIVLDMVGGEGAVFYREYLSQKYAPAINDKVWGTALRGRHASRFNNEVSGAITDDHVFINRVGIPCIDIVECNNQTTNSFPPTWHTLDDDITAIDRSTLQAVGQLVCDVIYNEK